MKFTKPVSPTVIRPGGKQPTIVVFGDSHSVAVSRAVRRRLQEGRSTPVIVFRSVKQKNGETIGDISFDDFLRRISQLGPEDVVVSMVGGSQYAVLGTAQHPKPFDFYAPGEGPPADLVAEIIPYRALNAFFGKCISEQVALESGGIIKGDGRRLSALRAATPAHVLHVIPPPPLYDNARIARRHENWLAAGIGKFGVAPPELRLKLWSLQARILQKLCRGFGINVMMPVAEATQDGFLRPEYHQGGAHANELYGELLLRSLEARFLLDEQGER